MDTLQVDSLNHSYNRNKVLSGIFLKIDSGEVVGILGRNGCGKSTMFNSIYGLFKDSTEVVKFNNDYVSKKNRWRNIAYLPQATFLPHDHKVKKTIKLFLDKEERDILYDDSRINRLLDQKNGSLSGGERRYLEFLLILSLNRSVTLLDEPFAEIEPKYFDLIFRKIQDKKEKGFSFLISDHNHWSVRDICSRLQIMRSGQFYQTDNSDSELKKRGYLPAIE